MAIIPSSVPGTKPISINPTWLMVLYANSLFKSLWNKAAKEPTSIEVIDKIIIIFPQSTLISPNGDTKNLMTTAKAATFGTTDYKAVMSVGEPW